MEDRVVREPERARITGISRTAWWEGERAERYPRRRRLSAFTVGWLLSELVAFAQALPVGGPAAPKAALVGAAAARAEKRAKGRRSEHPAA